MVLITCSHCKKQDDYKNCYQCGLYLPVELFRVKTKYAHQCELTGDKVLVEYRLKNCMECEGITQINKYLVKNYKVKKDDTIYTPEERKNYLEKKAKLEKELTEQDLKKLLIINFDE
jgi:hypothetical protein